MSVSVTKTPGAGGHEDKDSTRGVRTCKTQIRFRLTRPVDEQTLSFRRDVSRRDRSRAPIGRDVSRKVQRGRTHTITVCTNGWVTSVCGASLSGSATHRLCRGIISFTALPQSTVRDALHKAGTSKSHNKWLCVTRCNPASLQCCFSAATATEKVGLRAADALLQTVTTPLYNQIHFHALSWEREKSLLVATSGCQMHLPM